MTTSKPAMSSSRTLVMVVVGLWVGVLVGALVIGGLVWAGAVQLPGSSGGQSQVAGSDEAPLAQLESGTLATDFNLVDLEGKPVKLSDYRGKVVVFNFWATWCGPCVQEMPTFQEYQDRYPNFVMLGIDQEESAETVKNFLSKMPISYPILLDLKNDAAAAYKVMLLPTTIFVDEKGELRFRHYGVMSEEQLQYYLKTLKVISE